MVVKVVRLMEKVTGLLLGGIAVSVQAGNVIVCLSSLVIAASMLFRA